MSIPSKGRFSHCVDSDTCHDAIYDVTRFLDSLTGTHAETVESTGLYQGQVNEPRGLNYFSVLGYCAYSARGIAISPQRPTSFSEALIQPLVTRDGAFRPGLGKPN